MSFCSEHHQTASLRPLCFSSTLWPYAIERLRLTGQKKNVILGILPRMFPSTAQCILHKDPWEKFLLGLIIRKTCSAYNWHSSVSFFLFTIKGSLLLITFGGQEAQSYLGTVYCNKSYGLHLMVCILTFTFPPIFSFHKLLSPVTPLTISFIS